MVGATKVEPRARTKVATVRKQVASKLAAVPEPVALPSMADPNPSVAAGKETALAGEDT